MKIGWIICCFILISGCTQNTQVQVKEPINEREPFEIVKLNEHLDWAYIHQSRSNKVENSSKLSEDAKYMNDSGYAIVEIPFINIKGYIGDYMNSLILGKTSELMNDASERISARVIDEDEGFKEITQNVYSSNSSIRIKDDILSILMQSAIYYQDGTSEAFYDALNYDLLSGFTLTDDELLEYYGVKQESVIETLNQIIEENEWGVCSSIEEIQCYEADLFEDTKLEYFINEEGELRFFTNQFRYGIDKGFPFENARDAFKVEVE